MRASGCFLLSLLFCVSCLAQGNKFEETLSASGPTPLLIKIYSQTLSFQLPKGYTLGSRSEKAGAFTQVLKVAGESDDRWKQRILISGAKDVAIRDKEPIQLISNLMKFSFKGGCPESFSVTDVGEMKTNTGQSAFVFMVGCGIRRPVEKSEKDKMMAMAVVIRGNADVYSMLWTERSDTDEIPPLSWPIWRTRLDSLLPIQIY